MVKTIEFIPTYLIDTIRSPPPPSVISPSTYYKLKLPDMYEVDDTGVYLHRPSARLEHLRRIRLAYAPIFIGARVHNEDTGEARRQVIWRGSSGWCSRVVDRQTLSTPANIISLVNYDAPISRSTAIQLIEFLNEFEVCNTEAFPLVRSTTRLGWMRDGSFLLPDGHYSPEETNNPLQLTPPDGMEQTSAALTQSGDWESWLAAIRPLIDYPDMMTAIYASAAAPLLSILRVPGFVVDFSGPTCGGKTTALRVAASVWGRPCFDAPTCVFSWDTTPLWLENTMGYLGSIPLFLDDTQRARSTSTVPDFVYDFCQGQGRTRRSRAPVTWRSILFTTGTRPIIRTDGDPAIKARVLSLRGKPLGSNVIVGGRVSENLQIDLEQTYGHLGRKVISYLVSNSDRTVQIRQLFEKLRDHYISSAPSATARRHASSLAVLEVASKICHQLGVPEPTDSPFVRLVEIAYSANYTPADHNIAALKDVLSWAVAHQNRFWNRLPENEPPTESWVGAWSRRESWKQICFILADLRSLLTEFGYPPDTTIRVWRERGFIATGSQNNRTKPIKVAGELIRCVCLKREAIESYLDIELEM
jgi:putative DNA primase/helicase